MRYLTIIFLFIASFASAQQQMFLRSTPAAGVTGILGSYTGAEAAYATALLYSSYGGSCLRVRRDSDNAEQDIGFSGQDIDEAAINSFCSGANCFVRTWYDQSGSGNDATQTVAASQPKIYDSSTGITYENGIAAVTPVNTPIGMNTGFTGLLTKSVFVVVNDTPGIGSIPGDYIRYITGYSGSGGVGNELIYGDTPTTGSRINDGGTFSVDDVLTTRGHSLNTLIVNPTIYLARDGGGLVNTGISSSAANTSNYHLFDDFGGSNVESPKNMQACIIYSSDQTINKLGIENALNSYFNIFYINFLILLVRLPKRKEKNPA